MNGGFVALIVFLSLLGGGAIVGVTVFFFFQYKAITRLNESVTALLAILKPLADEDVMKNFFPAVKYGIQQIPSLTQALTATSTAFNLVAKSMFRGTVADTLTPNPLGAPDTGEGDFMAPPGAEEKLTESQLMDFLRKQGRDVPEDIEPPQDHIVHASAD
jgi:hypothetical protein